MFRFRLLPLILAAAFVVIFIRASDVLLGMTSHETKPLSSDAIAAEPNASEGEAEGEGDEAYQPEEPIYSPNAPKGPDAITPDDASKIERELLESLSKRRVELQAWSESISMRENILNATEMKINNKISDL